MNKKELIIKFEKLEEEILKLIHLPEIKLDDTVKRQTVLANIKKHILAIEKAKVLFAQYEDIANQIEEIEMLEKAQKAQKTQLSSKISATHNLQSRNEYKDELIVTDGKVQVIKKKKTSTKQM